MIFGVFFAAMAALLRGESSGESRSRRRRRWRKRRKSRRQTGEKSQNDQEMADSIPQKPSTNQANADSAGRTTQDTPTQLVVDIGEQPTPIQTSSKAVNERPNSLCTKNTSVNSGEAESHHSDPTNQPSNSNEEGRGFITISRRRWRKRRKSKQQSVEKSQQKADLTPHTQQPPTIASGCDSVHRDADRTPTPQPLVVDIEQSTLSDSTTTAPYNSLRTKNEAVNDGTSEAEVLTDEQLYSKSIDQPSHTDENAKSPIAGGNSVKECSDDNISTNMGNKRSDASACGSPSTDSSSQGTSYGEIVSDKSMAHGDRNLSGITGSGDSGYIDMILSSMEDKPITATSPSTIQPSTEQSCPVNLVTPDNEPHPVSDENCVPSNEREVLAGDGTAVVDVDTHASRVLSQVSGDSEGPAEDACESKGLPQDASSATQDSEEPNCDANQGHRDVSDTEEVTRDTTSGGEEQKDTEEPAPSDRVKSDGEGAAAKDTSGSEDVNEGDKDTSFTEEPEMGCDELAQDTNEGDKDVSGGRELAPDDSESTVDKTEELAREASDGDAPSQQDTSVGDELTQNTISSGGPVQDTCVPNQDANDSDATLNQDAKETGRESSDTDRLSQDTISTSNVVGELTNKLDCVPAFNTGSAVDEDGGDRHEEEVYEQVRSCGVALEVLEKAADSCTVIGTVLVCNECFEKAVGVRHSTDCWESFRDTPAQWVETVEGGEFDRFKFSVELCAEGGYHMEMALYFNQHWDNNNRRNYTVTHDKDI